MQQHRTVTNQYGIYEQTPLEAGVERLADEFKVMLSDLSPTYNIIHGLSLDRIAKNDGNPEINLWYSRKPSGIPHPIKNPNDYINKNIQRLYAAKPSEEFANLAIGDKKIIIETSSDKDGILIRSDRIADVLSKVMEIF